MEIIPQYSMPLGLSNDFAQGVSVTPSHFSHPRRITEVTGEAERPVVVSK
jgi:hypothetical protein